MTAAAAEPLVERALAVGQAVAQTLPSSEPLSAVGAQPGTEHVTSAFAGAAIAELESGGRIGVLVGEELVQALAASPLGGLDLAAATQPALDAGAAVLGTKAKAAHQVDLELVVGDIGEPFTAVPLLSSGIAAAVLLPDIVLDPSLTPPVEAAEEPFVVAESAGAAGAAAAAEAQAAAQAQAAPAAPAAQADAPVVSPAPVTPIPDPVPTAATAAARPMPGTVTPLVGRGLEMLHGVDMEVTVELGRTRMTVRDLLALTPGHVLELDRAAGSPADLLVNGRLIARGEVVVVDEDFGLRVTEIIDDSAAS
ncbi:MAG: flagellar motor switch protein FliN [Nocardioidaceae bacterium]